MRHFAITPTQYRALSTADKCKARENAIIYFEDYYEEIFQRRHEFYAL